MQTALRRRADSTAVLHRRELVPPTAQEEDCVATLYFIFISPTNMCTSLRRVIECHSTPPLHHMHRHHMLHRRHPNHSRR